MITRADRSFLFQAALLTGIVRKGRDDAAPLVLTTVVEASGVLLLSLLPSFLSFDGDLDGFTCGSSVLKDRYDGTNEHVDGACDERNHAKATDEE